VRHLGKDGEGVEEIIEERGVAEAVRVKHVASLLFTYRCTIACKHCLFNCSPQQPPVRASLSDSLEFLGQLSATDRVVHIAGGEPMIFYNELLAIWRAADRKGLSPHFFETNASWCTSNALTRRRLSCLRKAGAQGVLISCDPYHQASVPARSFLRARRIAAEVFGERNVMAHNPSRSDVQRMVEVGRSETLLAAHASRHPPRLVGRAGEELARHLPDRPIESLKGDALWHGKGPEDGSCRTEFDPDEMWEIHIDPYGNIQTCCGIILGNAHRTPLPDLMETGFAHNELARIVRDHGPFGLLRIAVERGYRPRDGYPQKCNLCWEVRKFLRPHFPEQLGPDEIYGPWGPSP
jgi:organic radical activating enzyme